MRCRHRNSYLISFLIIAFTLAFYHPYSYCQDSKSNKKIDRLLEQGISYYKSNNINKALKVLNDALIDSQKAGYLKGQGFAQIQLATLYLLIDPIRSVEYAKSAQGMVPFLNDREYENQVNGVLGDYHFLAGEFKESISLYSKGIDLSRDDFLFSSLLTVKKCLVEAFIGETVKPISQINMIIEEAKKKKNRIILKVAYFILGMVYKSNGEFIEAIKW